MLSPDVLQVRGLPPGRGPAALPAELSLRRLRLLGRQGLPVQHRGQLRRLLCPERRARRVAGAQLLRWVPSPLASPSAKRNRLPPPPMPSVPRHLSFAQLRLCIPAFRTGPGHLTAMACGSSSSAATFPSRLPAGHGGGHWLAHGTAWLPWPVSGGRVGPHTWRPRTRVSQPS